MLHALFILSDGPLDFCRGGRVHKTKLYTHFLLPSPQISLKFHETKSISCKLVKYVALCTTFSRAGHLHTHTPPKKVFSKIILHTKSCILPHKFQMYLLDLFEKKVNVHLPMRFAQQCDAPTSQFYTKIPPPSSTDFPLAPRQYILYSLFVSHLHQLSDGALVF